MTHAQNKRKEGHQNPLEIGLQHVITPFQEFISDQRVGSILLVLCTFVALLIANSPLAQDYEAFIKTPMGIVFGDLSFKMSIRHWINDGLMSLFFFVLGLEIKREVLAGELKDTQRSLPVIVAALGGMLAPAAIFTAFNTGSESIHGWGIPMATDTAFAVGILALLTHRIPPTLITFLTALAIIDDLGAILVIAIFYTENLNLHFLGLASMFLLLLITCNALGFRRPIVYVTGGAMVWIAMLSSGVHASVAGVLVALTIPARPKRQPLWFVNRARRLLDEFEDIEKQSDKPILSSENRHIVAERVQDTAEKATTPLRRWERTLEHPVTLLVMPVFALANANIPVNVQALPTMFTDDLVLGIVIGLIAGKCVGITFFCWLAVRLKLGRLTQGVSLRHIAGIGLLGGIGFTMSIFIADLGFSTDPQALLSAKTAILLTSLIAGILGYLLLRRITEHH